MGASWVDEIDADKEAIRIMSRKGGHYWEEPFIGLVLFSEMIDDIFPTSVNVSHPHPLVRRVGAVLDLEAEAGRDFPFNIAETLAAVILGLRSDWQFTSTSAAATDTLREWAKDVVPESLYIGILYEGSRFADVNELHMHLRTSSEHARSVVAYFACSTLDSSVMIAGRQFLRLGMFLEHFRAVWMNHPQLAAFEALLGDGLPFLDTIEEIWRRSHLDVGPNPV